MNLTIMVELEVTFCSHNARRGGASMGGVGRTQGGHKETGKSCKIREATKRKNHAKAGTSGYT